MDYFPLGNNKRNMSTETIVFRCNNHDNKLFEYIDVD